MSLLILNSGILTTIQDLGRNGHRKLGINPNGAMDRTAVRLINVLLENEENEAVLEMHFPASEIKFEQDTVFAIGGANFGTTLSNKSVNNWQVHTAKKGQLLKFTKKLLGNRCYLAVKGGFRLEKWLNSSSTNLTLGIGGFEGRKLVKRDKIELNSTLKVQNSKVPLKVARSIIPRYSESPTVRIIRGPEYQDLTAFSEQVFLSENYKVSSDSDRMGFRVDGKPLHRLSEKELISTAVSFGTMQLLRNGQIIILMADHQTTGGYPRIAHIIEKDLPLVAQLNAEDNLSFHLISSKDAENLSMKFEKDLAFLKMGIKFSKNLN